MANMFDAIVKAAGNQDISRVDGGLYSDVTTFMDTGAYSLNALLSGSLYGGLAGSHVSALAGEQAVGKTFFLLAVVKTFLEKYKKAAAIIFESEGAITKDMIESRGIDSTRVYIVPITTIQQFRTQATKILDEYAALDLADRQPMLFGLDSLGMVSTEKEVADIASGEDKRDMTRAQLIRGTFRVLTLKLARLGVPMILTNHVYDVIGSYVPMQDMGGGMGLKYAASNIIFLTKSKRKDKTTNQVTGVIIKCTLKKSRLTVENKQVEVLLDYQKGLDRYFGLLAIAEAVGVAKKVGTQYEIGGQKAFEINIEKNPEKYFTKEVLDKIEEGVGKIFKYGSDNDAFLEDEEKDEKRK